MRWILAFVAIVLVLLMADWASAGGGGWRSSKQSAFGARVGGHPSTYAGMNKQAVIGAQGRAAYPRYYWGIPAREYQNVGVPHGDIGILGSGIQREPW